MSGVRFFHKRLRCQRDAMDRLNLPAPKPAMPPSGITFHTNFDNPIAAVSTDLCTLAAFLQERNPPARLLRTEDWWQHDGLHFEKGPTDFHSLFQMAESPRSLLHSMQGDHRVLSVSVPPIVAGICVFLQTGTIAEKHCWESKALLGEYSLTLTEPAPHQFEAVVVPSLQCSVTRTCVEILRGICRAG